ncbi:cation:dicarboxylase symporter family transporter [Salmonella enterica subsp. enterica]|nr:cation:dicarboxylase symporter family transporter [Salmonella enterica subsp. enterica]
MAFTIGKYVCRFLLVQLGHIICSFISPVFSSWWWCWDDCTGNGFSILNSIRYIREELLIVLGTSSSESALPRMLDMMENGSRKRWWGLVIPDGYSFNLDGTSIYLDDGGGVYRPRDQQPYGYVFHQITLLVVLLLAVVLRCGRDRKRLYQKLAATIFRRRPFTGCGTGVNRYRPFYVRKRARAD